MGDGLDHTGRVVLVTGGTRGIGAGIAAAYAAAGATVVVCGRRDPGGGAAEFRPCDVREPDEVEALVAAIADAHGRLDVAINNAGGAPGADAATASPRFTEKVIRLNLLAPMFVAQAAYRVMAGQPSGGVITNIASVSGIRPSPGSSAYGAAKAGLLNLTQSLAVEWAPKVRVNAVTAGMVVTEESRGFYGDDESVARIEATVPMGRMGTPEDVAAACLWLSSPGASYVSGASIVLHGGGERPAFLGAAEG